MSWCAGAATDVAQHCWQASTGLGQGSSEHSSIVLGASKKKRGCSHTGLTGEWYMRRVSRLLVENMPVHGFAQYPGQCYLNRDTVETLYHIFKVQVGQEALVCSLQQGSLTLLQCIPAGTTLLPGSALGNALQAGGGDGKAG